MDPLRIVPPGLRELPAAVGTTPAVGKEATGFGAVLEDSLRQVNKLQGDANNAIKDLATGQGGTLHDTMLALEKAELSFRLMMQVRNKIVEAYQEVLRMQV